MLPWAFSLSHPTILSLPTCWRCVFFSRISCLRVSNGKQILSHWNSPEGYHIFSKFWQKKGWERSLKTHSKGRIFSLVLAQLNFSLKFHSHKGRRTFVSLYEKKKILSLLIICPILCHLGNTWSSQKILIWSRWFLQWNTMQYFVCSLYERSALKEKYKQNFVSLF